MKCRVCNTETAKFTEKEVLRKHSVSYFSCSACQFIQTEEPHWLEEAYQSAITSLDIGMIERNLYLRETIPAILDTFFPQAKLMVDYGGGYGIFVRMMRDKGYDFYRQDIYCENLFAKHFDVTDVNIKKFDVLTAFEVFEHLPEPIGEVEKMLALADNLIFTTLVPPADKKEFESWWYVSPLTGQHVAFYSVKTLEFIAKKFNRHFYTNKSNLHVFSKDPVDPVAVEKVFGEKQRSLLEKIQLRLKKDKPNNRKSLIESDYKMIESLLKQDKI